MPDKYQNDNERMMGAISEMACSTGEIGVTAFRMIRAAVGGMTGASKTAAQVMINAVNKKQIKITRDE